MKSFFDSAVLSELESRIAKLKPDSPRQWGKMNVSQMLTHCQGPIDVATNDLHVKRGLIGFLFGGYAKRKFLSDAPFGKSLPTVKEFLPPDAPDFEQEREKLLSKVRKLSQGGEKALTKNAHPFFGKMSFNEWGSLQYKHLDHHLRQFGV